MSSFVKGALFTMGGTEYEVLASGNADPSSCLVYIPAHEKDTSDPLRLRLWKAEAKLARGDITLHGFPEMELQHSSELQTKMEDSLSQLAELKQRIKAIEQRKVNLYKVDDLAGQILLHDNVVRPNKSFDIWSYTKSSPTPKIRCNIQFVKIRSIMLTITNPDMLNEHVLFPIQEQSDCHYNDDLLIINGKKKIILSGETKTLQGRKSENLNFPNGCHLELNLAFCFKCKYELGKAIIYARILNAAYKRILKSPTFAMNQLAIPAFDKKRIEVTGICMDIYTEELKNQN